MRTTIYEIDFLGKGGMKPVQDAQLQIGQIFFLNGYGQDQFHHERQAIYEITKCSFDGRTQYKWVNLDNPKKGIKNAWEIKHISQLFGIGTYYKDGDFATPEQITDAILAASEAEARAEDLSRINKIESDLVRERGEQLFKENWPTDKEPVGVIVAELHESDCDHYSDYYASKTTRTVILAFTFKKRADFNELRKACLNCDIEEVRAFAVKPIFSESGQEKTEANKEWWKPADEHRENYTGGSGTYLGEGGYSGWKIRKDTYRTISNYYYDAGKNGGFYAFRPEEKPQAKAEPVATTEKTALVSNCLQALDYSEKAFAVFGDTKTVKDTLKELGGRFNKFLTHPLTAQKCAGWVFSKKVKDIVLQELGLA